MIILKTNGVLYVTFEDNCSFYFFFLFFFYELTVCFAKTYVLPFPPIIIECIKALDYELIPSHGTVLPVPCSKGEQMWQILWQNMVIFMFKSYCSIQLN